VSDFRLSFLETILDNIADPLFVKDIDHRWVYVNNAFCQLTGYAQEDMIGNSDFDLFPADQAKVFWEKDELVFSTGKTNTNEESITDAKGNLLSISTKKSILVDEMKNKYLVAIIRDITEKKNLIESLQLSNMLLEKYAYLVSHDIKSPINQINKFAVLLQNSSREKLDEKGNTQIDYIEKTSNKLSQLVETLLNYSRVDHQMLTIEKINYSDFLSEFLKDQKDYFLSVEANIEVVSMPLTICLDKKLIEQVLQNLIYNAIKFRDEHRPLDIKLTYLDSPTHHQFCIQDNAIGIKETYLDTIFTMFTKLHSQKEYDGSGIGLALCKLIINSHKGSIWVESELGVGSKFFYTIAKDLESNF